MSSSPPWDLVSPTGVLHVVQSRLGLTEFIKAHPALGERNIRELVGKLPGSSSGAIVGGKHVKFWQLNNEMFWLEPVAGGAPVPLLGSRGRGGIDQFLKLVEAGSIDGCPHDTAFKKGALQAMLKGESATHAGWKVATQPAYTRDTWPTSRRQQWGEAEPIIHLPEFGAESSQHAPIATEGQRFEVCPSGLEPSRAHARESLNPIQPRPKPITQSRALALSARHVVRLQERARPTEQHAPLATEGVRLEVRLSGLRPSRAPAREHLNPTQPRPKPVVDASRGSIDSTHLTPVMPRAASGIPIGSSSGP